MGKWSDILKALRAPKLHISAEENHRREWNAKVRFDAQEAGAVHIEPDCRDHNGCKYPDPHHHGFACDNTCQECWGICHPDCPANKTIKEK